MRLSFALCAWALLLAAPGVHGLRPRDPAKLPAGPQSMIAPQLRGWSGGKCGGIGGRYAEWTRPGAGTVAGVAGAVATSDGVAALGAGDAVGVVPFN